MDAVTNVPPPVNEPVLDYAPGSPERTELEARLKQMAAMTTAAAASVASRAECVFCNRAARYATVT